MRATASDPDGDLLTYQWKTSAGSLQATAGPEATLDSSGMPAGEARVTVSVSDGRGGTAEADCRFSFVEAGTPVRLCSVTAGDGETDVVAVDQACRAAALDGLAVDPENRIGVRGYALDAEPGSWRLAHRRARRVADALRASGADPSRIMVLPPERLTAAAAAGRVDLLLLDAVGARRFELAQLAPGSVELLPFSPGPSPRGTPRPASTPRPSPPPDNGNVSYDADAVLERLEKGVLQWDPPPPPQMVVGTTVTVGATILPPQLAAAAARARAEAVSPAGPASRGTTAAAPVPTPTPAALPISPRMSARLYGTGFEIEPKDERIQDVTLSSPTNWTWQVTSREPGRRKLTIEVKIFLPPSFERQKSLLFDVEVEPRKRGPLEQVMRLWEGANKIWAAPLGAALVGGIIAWWRRRRPAGTP